MEWNDFFAERMSELIRIVWNTGNFGSCSMLYQYLLIKRHLCGYISDASVGQGSHIPRLYSIYQSRAHIIDFIVIECHGSLAYSWILRLKTRVLNTTPCREKGSLTRPHYFPPYPSTNPHSDPHRPTPTPPSSPLQEGSSRFLLTSLYIRSAQDGLQSHTKGRSGSPPYRYTNSDYVLNLIALDTLDHKL